MSRPRIRAWHIAPRLAAGAFILNAGLDKRTADQDTAAGLHGMAATAYPPLGRIEPARFTDGVSKSELALGAALLTPMVPSGVVGGALTAFSAGLLGLYARVPGMRRPDSVRPTADGLTIAKDVWLLGIGVGLLTEALLQRRSR